VTENAHGELDHDITEEQLYAITCNDGTGAAMVVVLDWLCCLKRYAWAHFRLQ